MKKKGSTSDSAKKKRTILAVSAVGLLTIIGGVIAYNQNSMFFNNLFHLAQYGPETFTETFESPDSWTCQETTPKSVIYENHTGVTRAVRVKYEDYWKKKGSTSTNHETELPLEKNGERLTTINLQNEEDWILNEDGWYYYRYEVPDGATSTDFMESVTFNCEFEETEEYECTDTATGKSCSSKESDYMEANYHVFVTIQTETAPNWPYTPVPSRQTLYDVIASQTNGVDTNIDLNTYATTDNNNGNGVNTLAAHKDDRYPVYYYRGEVNNNTVVFDDICWRIVRTAERGAVKMIYSGEYADGHCSDDYTTFYVGNKVSWADYNSQLPDSPADSGYMYGAKRYKRSTMTFRADGYGGTGVTWDGTKYTLVNPKKVSDITEDELKDTYRYYCYYGDAVNNDWTTCRDRVFYIEGNVYGKNTGTNGTADGRQLMLTGGVDKVGAMADMTKNELDSNVKRVVDNWFETAIVNNRDKLADVVYCNDRHITYGSLGEAGTYNQTDLYDGWVRVGGVETNGAKAHASVDCTQKNDAFTVSSKNGNGALKYPAAIMTADEYTLGGIGFSGGYWGITRGTSSSISCVWNSDFSRIKNNYLYSKYETSYTRTHTMTPLAWNSSSYIIHAGSENLNGEFADSSSGYVRPVIALKYRTYIKSGTGTLADPYILEWDD